MSGGLYRRVRAFCDTGSRAILGLSQVLGVTAFCAFSAMALDVREARAMPVSCASTSVTVNSNAINETFVGTSDYRVDAGDTLNISFFGPSGVGINVTLNGITIGTVILDGSNTQTATFPAASTIIGRFQFDFSNNTTGTTASVQITCSPAAKTGVSINQATDQIDETVSVTNPETVDGNVFGTYSVPTFFNSLRGQPVRFPQEIEEAIGTPADEETSTRDNNEPIRLLPQETDITDQIEVSQECLDCRERLKKKQAEFAEIFAKFGKAFADLFVAGNPRRDAVRALDAMLSNLDEKSAEEALETAREFLDAEKLDEIVQEAEQADAIAAELANIAAQQSAEDSKLEKERKQLADRETVADFLERTPPEFGTVEEHAKNNAEARKRIEEDRKNAEQNHTDRSAELENRKKFVSAANLIEALSDAVENGPLSEEEEALKEKQQELQEQGEKLQEEINQLKQECIKICGGTAEQANLKNMSVPQDHTSNLLAYASTKPVGSGARTAIESRTTVSSTQGFALSGNDRNINARFDLREWRKARAKTDAAYAERLNSAHAFGVTGPLLDDPRFNLFGATAISFGENNSRGVGQDSISYAFSAGASYLLSPTLNVGIAGRFGKANINSAISDIDTRTWGIAAFAQKKLDRVNLEAIIAWSRSNIDSLFNNAGTVTATDTVRTALSGQVTASTTIDFGQYSFSPSISVTHVGTDRDAFTLSDGQVAAALGDSLWLYGLGGSFGFQPFETSSAIFTPGLGVSLAGDFEGGNDVNLSTNLSLAIAGKNGLSGNIGIGYSGIGGDAQNLSFSGSITIPLN